MAPRSSSPLPWLLMLLLLRGSAARGQLVPAMFIFGDSLIDNGNNNNLASFAKANYYPYGIDFAGGPTGRFSNGYTVVDEIAAGSAADTGPLSGNFHDDVLHGLNYASAAAGILDITGQNFVGRIPFNQQISNFESTLDQITSRLGAAEATSSIGRCIFFVGMGSNDYLNNYLLPNYPTRLQYNGDQYADLLVQQFNRQLTRLYNLGARRFVLTSVGSLACIPSILAQNPFSRCNEDVDELVIPSTHAVIDRGCCGIGRNRGQITCLPFQTPCRNRDQYVFWDAFHPTSAVNVILGRKAFFGGPDEVYPNNVRQLATMNLR
ncbi:unnamed protein product [Spirodela intermedia]|uniref:Uncharacterized protein n=1 Tax=Spirodela intermedia TaxID=51605 RepID=A0A7I8IQS1_SPIIN|nr:unnamed protein product [Spirodela intermedia]CAA6660221.1 unnamed protein product [Spirodela intermedia]